MNKDIDFIKWMCGKADGFRLEEDHTLFLPTGDFLWEESVLDGDYEEWKAIYYPLLLQRAIEGVNREYEIDCNNYSIDLMNDDIEVSFDCYSRAHHFVKDFDSIDTAKESALRYIWEEENDM